MRHQARITVRLLGALLGVSAAALAARAGEENLWPAWVGRTDPAGGVISWTALGPLLFSQPRAGGGREDGLRPLYVERTRPRGGVTEADVLYPLFFYRTYGDDYSWSVFNLINGTGPRAGNPAAAKETRGFDLWPFYFSRETGDPATSYRALLPVAGTIKQRLGYDRLSWVLFPLYVQTEKAGAVTTDTPWPVVRSTRGAARGFAVWPLFGWEDRPGAYRRAYGLWPLFWDNTVQPKPGSPAGTPPTRQFGMLPFYVSERGPDLVSQTYLWPFFGTTDRTGPKAYHETRYLWPFLVQGRGADRWVDRWGPFYTHSIVEGTDKTWILWPLWRRTRWTGDGRDQTRDTLLYFLYSSTVQRDPDRPRAVPARKVQVWPLFSFWRDAGRSQGEILSPFEPLFADNEPMREAWTPIAALVRWEDDPSGARRGSLLWNAVTWRSEPRQGRGEFHLGPLFGEESGPGGRRLAFLDGLFGLRRGPRPGSWRPFLLEFSPRSPRVSARSP